MKEMSIMLSRSPFITESFITEEGGKILNISVRYSPESSQQRGGKKAREKRRERRELERTGQSVSQAGSQRTSLENGEIKEERNEYGTDENCFIIQDNQSDDSDINSQSVKACLKLFAERHQLGAVPVTSLQKQVTSQKRDHDRLVKFKPDRENHGHLIGLLEHKLEHKFKLLEHLSLIHI